MRQLAVEALIGVMSAEVKVMCRLQVQGTPVQLRSRRRCPRRFASPLAVERKQLAVLIPELQTLRPMDGA